MSGITMETMMKIGRQGPPPRLKHGPAFDAVFEPFVCDGEEFFRYYDASTWVWMIGRTVPLKERKPLDLSAAEVENTPGRPKWRQ